MDKELAIKENIVDFIPAFRMLLSSSSLKVTRLLYKEFAAPYINDKDLFDKAVSSFKFSQTALWDGKYVYLSDSKSPEILIDSFINELGKYKSKFQKSPKVIVINGYGILASDVSSLAVSILHDEIENCLLHSFNNTTKLIGAILLEKSKTAQSPLFDQKICIVTGGAQGFGEGISRILVEENANVMLADVNDLTGLKTCQVLKPVRFTNEVLYQQTDVSKSESVKRLIFNTVKQFGGIDLLISNAGILRAGGLDEMEPETFELMTKINYEGYFLCSKYASAVMKLQSKYKKEYFADIIQINSKSGLKGSKRNFAYAGGKFGGIGLTQSFALELAPYRIKVNAICPGNYFEGPLWSDPVNGLFVQYLNTGKVPGAKTVDDVRKFYEAQVPLGRGCRVEDIMKAIQYVVSQEYETGQAIPVTGGQEMIN